VALIGAGWIADPHAEVLSGRAGLEGVEVVLACDPDRARAEGLSKRFGIPRVLTSIDEIRPGEVDLAHLLVPPDLHEALARRLLELGIGVLVEKPLALSAAGARDLAGIAARHGLPLGANHNFVFHPAFIRLLARVRAGQIGRIEHVSVTLSVPLAQLEAGAFGHWMFQAPTNIVYEQAVHPLSLVHALIGRVESASTAILSSRELAPGQIFHTAWSIAARAERGTAEVHLAFGAAFERFRVDVRGTDGFLEADLRRDTLSGEGKSAWLDFFDSYLASSRRGAMLRREARRGLRSYLLSSLGLARRGDAFFASMRGSLQSFHRAIARGVAPASDAHVAVEVLEWCDAVAQATGPSSPPSLPARARAPAPPPERRSRSEATRSGETGTRGRATSSRNNQRTRRCERPAIPTTWRRLETWPREPRWASRKPTATLRRPIASFRLGTSRTSTSRSSRTWN
jgi:predicted dehydrogenase